MDIISTNAARSNSKAMMARGDKHETWCYFMSITHIACTQNTCTGTSLPATTPDDMVAIAGLPLAVTFVKGWKSRPSLAMANSTRGIGNMEPSRLERQTSRVRKWAPGLRGQLFPTTAVCSLFEGVGLWLDFSHYCFTSDEVLPLVKLWDLRYFLFLHVNHQLWDAHAKQVFVALFTILVYGDTKIYK